MQPLNWWSQGQCTFGPAGPAMRGTPGSTGASGCRARAENPFPVDGRRILVHRCGSFTFVDVDTSRSLVTESGCVLTHSLPAVIRQGPKTPAGVTAKCLLWYADFEQNVSAEPFLPSRQRPACPYFPSSTAKSLPA
jgi:hypothetical protein